MQEKAAMGALGRHFGRVAWLLLFLSWLPWSLAAQRSGPQVGRVLAPQRATTDAHPELQALEAELAQLQAHPQAADVTPILNVARDALMRARAAAATPEHAALDRTAGVARAALAAANRILVRDDAARALEATRHRHAHAQAAHHAAREALDHARAQHASTVATTP